MSGPGANRHESARRPYRPDGTLAVCSSKAHSRGAVVQQPARAIPLFEISTTRRGACQVFGVGPGTPYRVPGMEFGATAPGQSRPLYRLERRGDGKSTRLNSSYI